MQCIYVVCNTYSLPHLKLYIEKYKIQMQKIQCTIKTEGNIPVLGKLRKYSHCPVANHNPFIKKYAKILHESLYFSR